MDEQLNQNKPTKEKVKLKTKNDMDHTRFRNKFTYKVNGSPSGQDLGLILIFAVVAFVMTIVLIVVFI